jgi:hypothetical protein
MKINLIYKSSCKGVDAIYVKQRRFKLFNNILFGIHFVYDDAVVSQR